jgi:histidinol-phosphate/aromatic aminotransferase/cobyric acid decarboxylase-like protein
MARSQPSTQRGQIKTAHAGVSLRHPMVASEVSATVTERERVRSAFAAAGYEAPAVHTNFVLVRMSDAPAVARTLEQQGLVVRAYRGSGSRFARRR